MGFSLVQSPDPLEVLEPLLSAENGRGIVADRGGPVGFHGGPNASVVFLLKDILLCVALLKDLLGILFICSRVLKQIQVKQHFLWDYYLILI